MSLTAPIQNKQKKETTEMNTPGKHNIEDGGPTCSPEDRATLAQLLTLTGPLAVNQPRDISKETCRFWEKHGGLLQCRLRTLRYRPANLYCGNLYSQFDPDYSKFADIAISLREIGLINLIENPRRSPDIVLTTDLYLAESLGNPKDNFAGIFVLGKFTRKNMNREGKHIPPNWIVLPPKTDLTAGGDLEWRIRRLIEEMHHRLL
ncbi:MAG: hypothetical protein RLZZ517_186 [Candidatus Parcubacteria bacterium]